MLELFTFKTCKTISSFIYQIVYVLFVNNSKVVIKLRLAHLSRTYIYLGLSYLST